MNWTTDYQCPICSAEATQQKSTPGDFHEINCPVCGLYNISGSALATAKNKSPEERERALHNARAAVQRPDEIPVISSREFE